MAETALIMAGGRSERMRASGSPLHKGLRTVRGVPLIEHNLRALEAAGFSRICVALNRRESGLLEWARARPALQLLFEDAPLGTIGAAALLPADAGEVLVVNVDNLTTLDLRALLAFHRAERALATIASHEEPFPLPFGMLELDGERVVAYREKPRIPVTISSGLYVLSRPAIERLEPGVRTDVPALIERLLREGGKVAAYRHRERWIDVNDEAMLQIAEELFR